MDSFETLIRLLLEQDDHWTLQSHKVALSKHARRALGKPSMPRSEIDLIAFKPRQNIALVVEVKSFLDSPGVKFEDLTARFDTPTGRYKLFTCDAYRAAVFDQLRHDLIERGLCNRDTNFILGLAAGNTYRKDTDAIADYFRKQGWFFLSPDQIREKTRQLAKLGYENNPFVISAKLLGRDTNAN